MTPIIQTTPTPATSPWLPRSAVIEEIDAETAGVATYRLRESGPESRRGYDFLPGQFNMLYLPGFGEVAISMSGRRPKHAGQETSQSWMHTIRQAGQVTGAMARLKIGDHLAVRGPFGKPWPLQHCEGTDVIVMAGGIGLAPLRPAIYAFIADRRKYGRIILMYGARSADNLLYQQEYRAWQEAGCEVLLTVDRATANWNGCVGVVPRLLDRVHLAKPDQTVILSCGPEVMMRYVALEARDRGVRAENIWISLERHMQCAVGLCGHCQLGTALVCRDGPVFRWDHAAPLLTVHDW